MSSLMQSHSDSVSSSPQQRKEHPDEHTRSIHQRVPHPEWNQPAKSKIQERLENGLGTDDNKRKVMYFESKVRGMKAAGGPTGPRQYSRVRPVLEGFGRSR